MGPLSPLSAVGGASLDLNGPIRMDGMINELEIHNFKSIKDLTLPCKRFNLFIGEPNTGKSNILEALGLVSFAQVQEPDPDAELRSFVRHNQLYNLFYDGVVDDELSIRFDGFELGGTYRSDRGFHGLLTGPAGRWHDFEMEEGERPYSRGLYVPQDPPSTVNYYKFPVFDGFKESDSSFLLPPHGKNLLSLLANKRELREIIGLPFSALGYRLWLRPHENQIDVAKASDDIVVTSFPYSLASETLQRTTFYTAAIETNKNSVIVLEEPEAHSFPAETKVLAEQIAMDENDNQYFIVTHNPYFLMPLLSKAPKGDTAINIVYNEEYQTRVRGLSPEELPELFELDIFANLERYLEP